MTIFDVVVNTDDLVVLGPPNVIDVAVSVGRQGNRGSTYYVGSGNPNISSVSENVFGETITPITGDLFINTSSGAEYGWLYVYNPKIVGNQWDEALRLQPPFTSFNEELTFSSGVATMTTPISNILPPGVVQNDPDKYIVNITSNYDNPVAVSISSKSIVSSNLEVELKAVKYDIATSTWSTPSETLELSVNITVI